MGLKFSLQKCDINKAVRNGIRGGFFLELLTFWKLHKALYLPLWTLSSLKFYYTRSMAPFTILRFESPTKWCMKSKGKVYFSLYEKHLLYVNPLRLISIWSFNYSCKKSYWKWYTVYWEPATILCIWCLNVLSCKEPCCSPFQSQRDWEEETNSNKTTNNKGLPKRSKGMFHKVSHLLTLF